MEVIVYVSMMEDIINCNDKDLIIKMIEKTLTNDEIYEKSKKCNMLFRNLDDKFSKLYAKELSTNLTDLEIISDTLINTELSKKYGIEVLDLRNYQYFMLEHVMSKNESIDSLVNGKSNGEQLVISSTLISHRNHVPFFRAKNNSSIIFGCCTMPEELLIKSSIGNMASNELMKKYNFEINERIYTAIQRGVMETSASSEGFNSEILCYRAGLKFKYIILPGGKEPTPKEIEIAKQYNLKFVIVQDFEKSIDNPKKINNTKVNLENHQKNDKPFGCEQDFSKLLELLNHKKDNHLKKIAIFTDSHGLFEPTLAILEDARQNGVDEIYSLGDNIGTGPNPKEVMDLLQAYNVESLRGNHEIYINDEGIDQLREHLEKTGALSEAKRNSIWTRSQLTEDQIRKIRELPDDLIITIGGKKVMLSHYIRDYNTGKEKGIPSDINHVFQGHIHFEKEDGIVSTLRGVGIGGESGIASYVILSEKENGGFDIEYRKVKFDLKNSQYDISESNMSQEDKNKITSWIGGKTR